MFRNILLTSKFIFTRTFSNINHINKIPSNDRKFFKYVKSYLLISSISSTTYYIYKAYILTSQETELLKIILRDENIQNTIPFKDLISNSIASFILGPILFPWLIYNNIYKFINKYI